MKLAIKIVPVLLICVMGFSEITAQTYVSPSRELVEQLLNRLETCKASLANANKGIAAMKKNPQDYSLETYLWVENLAKEADKCIADLRKQLDKLRKDYPGWFNSPSAFADINLRPPTLRSPLEMEDALAKIERKIHNALAQFKEFQKPEH
ncbi:MAG: hypothetical protein AAF489_08325 [Bacteroidota bacterium]